VLDQVLDLGELVDREDAEAFVCGSRARPVESADLVEGEPDALGGDDDRESSTASAR
jgi:hypothetical protein